MRNSVNFISIYSNLFPLTIFIVSNTLISLSVSAKCQVRVEAPTTKSDCAGWSSLSHTSEAVIDEYVVLGRNDELQG